MPGTHPSRLCGASPVLPGQMPEKGGLSRQPCFLYDAVWSHMRRFVMRGARSSLDALGENDDYGVEVG